jgi:RNA polymerase sigma-70 factor (ECF subfamily)
MNRRSEERRLRAYAKAAALEARPEPDVEIEARLDAVALGPALAVALAELSPALREVLLLHAWGALSTCRSWRPRRRAPRLCSTG